MTTKDYLREVEAEAKKMEIREMCEKDPRKKARFRKRKKQLEALRMAFDRKFVTSEGKTMEYETATVNLKQKASK